MTNLVQAIYGREFPYATLSINLLACFTNCVRDAHLWSLPDRSIWGSFIEISKSMRDRHSERPVTQSCPSVAIAPPPAPSVVDQVA